MQVGAGGCSCCPWVFTVLSPGVHMPFGHYPFCWVWVQGPAGPDSGPHYGRTPLLCGGQLRAIKQQQVEPCPCVLARQLCEEGLLWPVQGASRWVADMLCSQHCAHFRRPLCGPWVAWLGLCWFPAGVHCGWRPALALPCLPSDRSHLSSCSFVGTQQAGIPHGQAWGDWGPLGQGVANRPPPPPHQGCESR